MMKFIVQWDFLLGNMDALIILNHKMNFGDNIIRPNFANLKIVKRHNINTSVGSAA